MVPQSVWKLNIDQILLDQVGGVGGVGVGAHWQVYPKRRNNVKLQD